MVKVSQRDLPEPIVEPRPHEKHGVVRPGRRGRGRVTGSWEAGHPSWLAAPHQFVSADVKQYASGACGSDVHFTSLPLLCSKTSGSHQTAGGAAGRRGEARTPEHHPIMDSLYSQFMWSPK